MDENIYKEECEIPSQKENPDIDASNRIVEAEMVFINPTISTEEEDKLLKQDLILLKAAYENKNTPKTITLLFDFADFLSKHNKKATLPGFIDFEIDEVLFSLMDQNDDFTIKKFALKCVALISSISSKEIKDLMINKKIIERLCSILPQPYFEGKEFIFLALGNFNDDNDEIVKAFTENCDIDEIFDIAVECSAMSHTDFIQYFFWVLTKHINLSMEQCEVFVNFFFLAFFNKEGLRYALMGFSELLNQDDFDTDILEHKFVLNQLVSLCDNSTDGIILGYAMKFVADLSKKEIFLKINLERILYFLSKYETPWFCCMMLDSLSTMITNYPDDLIAFLLENDAFSLLYSIQSRDFNEKISIIRCVSSLLLRVSDSLLIEKCDTDLIEFISTAIEYEKEEVVLPTIMAINRIVHISELSSIVNESILPDLIDDIEELDQNEQIHSIAQEIVIALRPPDE